MSKLFYTSPFEFEAIPMIKETDIPEQIKKLSELKDGWDFGDGIGISKEVAENACYIFNHFERNEFKYAVNPTSNGSIKITAQIGINFLDLTINTDLTIDITHEVGIGAEYDTVFEMENVSMVEIEKHLNSLLIQSCFLSERYTSGSTILLNNDLIATPLKISTEEYPLSTLIAQSVQVITYTLI